MRIPFTALDFFEHHREILEKIDALHQDVGLVRDEYFPIFRTGIGFRCGQDLEILGVFIRPYVEQILAMIDVVAMFFLACQKHLRTALRLVRTLVADFAGVGAVDVQKNILTVARAGDVNGVKFILLFVDRLQFRIAESVAP
jgi:hypothetical protein